MKRLIICSSLLFFAPTISAEKSSSQKGSVTGEIHSDETRASGSNFNGNYLILPQLLLTGGFGGTKDLRYDDLLQEFKNYGTGQWNLGLGNHPDNIFVFSGELGAYGQAATVATSYLRGKISYRFKDFYFSVAPEWRTTTAKVDVGGGIRSRISKSTGFTSILGYQLHKWTAQWIFTEFWYDGEFDDINFSLLNLFRPVTGSFLQSLDARRSSLEVSYSWRRYSIGASTEKSWAQYLGYVNDTGTLFGTFFLDNHWSFDLALGRSGDQLTQRSERIGFMNLSATYEF